MEVDRKIALLKKVLGPIRMDKSQRNELLFTCPKCHHHRNKLSVNFVTDKFHCWHCKFGSSDGLTRLFWLLGDKNIVDEYLSSSKKKAEVVKIVERPKLPDEFYSLADKSNNSIYAKHARAFLAKRNVTEEQIVLYKIGFAEEGRYRNRVIVPSFDEFGNLNFFVGRTIYDEDVKYRHGIFDKDIIFNDLFVDWSQPVIVTEGPFDAIAGGTNAIPLQGTYLNKASKLFNKIVTEKATVYLALDSDAQRHTLKTAQLLMSYGIDCRLVSLFGKKDLGELSPSEVAKTISMASKPLSSIDLLKTRIQFENCSHI